MNPDPTRIQLYRVSSSLIARGTSRIGRNVAGGDPERLREIRFVLGLRGDLELTRMMDQVEDEAAGVDMEEFLSRNPDLA
ncbi:MAG TPA: hypothetical protein DIU14_01470 [Actinobacteria bacterium]|nr:hypothetical protein [Actinomycetota bacterium]